MSEGLVCLKCRRYIKAKPDQWSCKCDEPQPSLDGKTPL